jgi:hypothetical protein
MTRGAAVLIAIVCLLVGCVSVQDASKKTDVLRERAQQTWRRNMAIVDTSINVWKARSGAYDPRQLEIAICFFEKLTHINSGNMSFIGPIPDERLENNSGEWKAWYVTYGAHLIYDGSKRRVVVSN